MGQRWWVVSCLATLWLPDKIKIAENQTINSYLRCPEQESNLHASRHSHLKRARLPFRHLGPQNCLFSYFSCLLCSRTENSRQCLALSLSRCKVSDYFASDQIFQGFFWCLLSVRSGSLRPYYSAYSQT